MKKIFPILIVVLILSIMLFGCVPDIKMEDITETDFSGIDERLGFKVGWIIEEVMTARGKEVQVTVISEKAIYAELSYGASVNIVGSSSSESAYYSSTFAEKQALLTFITVRRYDHYDITIKISKKRNATEGNYIEIKTVYNNIA